MRRIFAPLRVRRFALLWTGMTVSLVGDGVLLVALAWKVYELSNATTAMSAVGVAMTVPHVALLLLGGVASDRLDRRRLMIASDVVRGSAVAILGILALGGDLRLWHVFVLVAAYGAATAFFGPPSTPSCPRSSRPSTWCRPTPSTSSCARAPCA